MKERAIWVNRKSKIGRCISSIKEKQNKQEKKQILSRPIDDLATIIMLKIMLARRPRIKEFTL